MSARIRLFPWLGALLALTVLAVFPASGWAQKRGGILVMVVAGNPPSFDGHQEATFAMVHPTAPHYSLLIKSDPTDPTGVSKVPDIATSWKSSKDGLTYTFKIRKGVKFHDGTVLSALDVVATFKKLVWPPKGTRSARRRFFVMIKSVSNPDKQTVVFKLNYATAAFLSVVAIPFNYIYSADVLEKDMNWYMQNINGTGPFKFVSYSAGSSWMGKRNENYFLPGLPYLDGYEVIFAPKMNLRVQAIRGRRAMIEFRGFPPAARDDLKRALGDDITVQESTWNCSNVIIPNSKKKPFDDVRVRQALNLALDRWQASRTLSRIAIMKTVGHAVFPGHPLALTNEELDQNLLGYSRDIKASRAKARKLLKAAGVPKGFKFELHNRAVDQPYKILGTWVVDQWRQIGLNVEQKAVPTGPWIRGLRKKPADFDVAIGANCQTVVNPTLDVSAFLSSDRRSGPGDFIDRELDRLYDAQLREPDQKKQRELLKKFQVRLSEQSYFLFTLWWHKINPHLSIVKGWNITPSHYLNQDLTTVWLDQ